MSSRSKSEAAPHRHRWSPAEDDSLEQALGRAYGYLNRRDRTVREVQHYLERHGSADAAEQAVAVLQDEGYLNDARYARLFAEDKRSLEQWGSDRIARTLSARGIERELIDDALAGAAEETEFRRALSLLRRRFPDPPRERRERDRALGLLLRKGYDGELALDVLTAYGRDAGEASLG